MLRQITLSFQENKKTNHTDMLLNGENVEQEIRQTSLSLQMKPIVVSPSVRSWLGEQQKEIGKEGGIVVDGRDMGTAVFPQAQLKLFLTGDVSIRAQRRYHDLKTKQEGLSLEDVYSDIAQRDETDYLGPDAVNSQAHDAITLDTSILTIDEQIDFAYQLALEKIHS